LRFSILLIVLALVIAGALLWLLWQPYLRVSRVEVYGADQSLASYAKVAMQGAYLGILPRDSILFVPEGRIRRAILAEHPEIAAVSIFRASFTSVSLRAIERVAVGQWCGSNYSPPAAAASSSESGCYFFDGNGYIYELAGAASPPALNTFAVYDALAASTTEPLRATLAGADQLPDAFAFARSVSAMGSPVEAVAIRSDAGEVDDRLGSGTRITYVLGEEQQAYAALSSALADLNLSDGSISYIDLRFPGDIYVKKAGQ
jgi:hypothetical protein